MIHPRVSATFVLLLAAPFALATAPPSIARAGTSPVAARTATPAVDAPFWTGKPDAVRFTQAQERRLAHAKADIARMIAARGTRTIGNTLVPYDQALRELDASSAQAGLIAEVHPDSSLRDSAEKVSQKISAYYTELSLNRGVYDALASLKTDGLDPATAFYLTRTLRDFRLSGVDKDEATRKRIRKISDELVETGQEFNRNIRSDKATVVVGGVADLAGLPADFIERHKPGPDGSITLTTEYPDYFPVMTYSKREDVRKRIYIAYQNRAYPQNMAVLDSLIAKRHRLANLAGYPTWAEYHTADKMVGSARNASDFIDKIVAATTERVKADYEVLLARKRKDVPGATGIDWWDRFYWPALVKKEQYDFDAEKLRPYFPFDRVQQGVLDVTARMFGVTYKRVPDAPVWDPSVDCYEMFEGGKRVGRFYLDMHPRPNKYSHAAQFDIRTGVEGVQIPEAALICNLPGGTPGDPGLCEMNDVVTFFHEFGHLLHNLFAGHQRWAGIGGIRTERDFVEAPSQMLEEWMRDPVVLQSFARHYQTGEKLPLALIQQLRHADSFGDLDPRGIDIRRQMMLARLSLSIYDRAPSAVNTDSLNARLTREYTPYPYVPDTHFQCAFTHLDNYTAGYYTYMWSKVIAKDMFSHFDASNLLDPTIATSYRDAVLAPGGSMPAAKLVEHFLGRPFNFEAYRAWLNGVN